VIFQNVYMYIPDSECRFLVSSHTVQSTKVAHHLRSPASDVANRANVLILFTLNSAIKVSSISLNKP